MRYGTYSIRRTKPIFIYRRMRNVSAVQLLLSHTKVASTVNYIDIGLTTLVEIAEKN